MEYHVSDALATPRGLHTSIGVARLMPRVSRARGWERAYAHARRAASLSLFGENIAVDLRRL